MGRKRVALFQSRHTLQIQTAFLVTLLQEAGYDVDVFLYRCSTRIFDSKDLCTTVHDLTPKGTSWKEMSSTSGRWRAALREFLVDPLFASESDFLGRGIVGETVRLVGAYKYHCFVGIEKLGLVWAGLVARRMRIPVVYQSYELFSGNYILGISPLRWIRFLRTRKLEKQFHRTTVATIIQDKVRADVLRKTNRHPLMKSLLVPIGLKGSSHTVKSRFLSKRFPQLDGRIVVMQFGLIEARRFSVELIQRAQEFPANWALLLHGRFEGSETSESLAKLDRNKKVVFSDHLVPAGDLDDLISSSHIGLGFYPDKTLNEFTAGFSSEKIARYMKCGIPVVAFSYPTFRDSVERTGAGVCISDLGQLSVAINTIYGDYERYRANAYKAYERYFRLDTQFEKVVDFIDRLA